VVNVNDPVFALKAQTAILPAIEIAGFLAGTSMTQPLEAEPECGYRNPLRRWIK
jgi:hypothetical protein